MPVELTVSETQVVLESASEPGPAGPGVPSGGTAGQVLTKDSGTDYDTSWQDSAGGGGGAPDDATYLVTTANPDLSAEVVVGATPGGELGGTWASPTVDASHSGSTHAAVQAAAEATAAAALAAHEGDTTSVHGIADTSALDTVSARNSAIASHEADTTAVHGIADTSALALTANVQPLDSDLTAIAGLAPTNDDVIQRKTGAWTNRTMAQLIADLAALGTTFQPLDSDLTAFAGLNIAADKLPYGNGSHTLTLTDFTSAARALLDDADASAMLTTLGLSTFVKTLMDDSDASTFLSTLGVSTFIKTLLDDADAATARATLGIGGETLIEEIIVGSGGVATIDFQNIPATYRHLRIDALLRVENNGDWYEMRFNNDSGANYGRAAFGGGTGGLAQASNVGDSIWIGYITDDDTHADDAASMSIVIPYYAVTTMRKSCHSHGSTKIGSNNYAFVGGGNWRNTAAISRIQLFRVGADTAEHSRFALYGRT